MLRGIIMITIEKVTEFLGWCLALNIAVLAITGIALLLGRDWITAVHSQLSGVNQDQLSTEYFRYLSHYKVITIAFFLVPYLALKLMA